jgi:TRAP-type C4-dicarboxylate transport system substrate-binding protein
MNIPQSLDDISSNLNRIVNFYIRGSNINFHFVTESIQLISEISFESLSQNLQQILNSTLKLLETLVTEKTLTYDLADDALTFSTILSSHARFLRI